MFIYITKCITFLVLKTNESIRRIRRKKPAQTRKIEAERLQP